MKVLLCRCNNTACVAYGFDYDAGDGIRVFANYDVFEKLRAKAIAFFPRGKAIAVVGWREDLKKAGHVRLEGRFAFPVPLAAMAP